MQMPGLLAEWPVLDRIPRHGHCVMHNIQDELDISEFARPEELLSVCKDPLQHDDAHGRLDVAVDEGKPSSIKPFAPGLRPCFRGEADRLGSEYRLFSHGRPGTQEREQRGERLKLLYDQKAQWLLRLHNVAKAYKEQPGNAIEWRSDRRVTEFDLITLETCLISGDLGTKSGNLCPL